MTLAHNHPTRDIKSPGMCPKCDQLHHKVQQCPACSGQGYWIGTHYVTRDMASDACEPSMEGDGDGGEGSVRSVRRRRANPRRSINGR